MQFFSHACVSLHRGSRYGSWTSELHRNVARSAGCVPLRFSSFMGPCRLHSLFLRPLDAIPISSSRPLHRTMAFSHNQRVRGKSDLHNLGLSLRRQCVRGIRCLVSSLYMCTWCCFCSCKRCTSTCKYCCNHERPSSIALFKRALTVVSEGNSATACGTASALVPGSRDFEAFLAVASAEAREAASASAVDSLSSSVLAASMLYVVFCDRRAERSCPGCYGTQATLVRAHLDALGCL